MMKTLLLSIEIVLLSCIFCYGKKLSPFQVVFLEGNVISQKLSRQLLPLEYIVLDDELKFVDDNSFVILFNQQEGYTVELNGIGCKSFQINILLNLSNRKEQKKGRYELVDISLLYKDQGELLQFQNRPLIVFAPLNNEREINSDDFKVKWVNIRDENSQKYEIEVLNKFGNILLTKTLDRSELDFNFKIEGITDEFVIIKIYDCNDTKISTSITLINKKDPLRVKNECLKINEAIDLIYAIELESLGAFAFANYYFLKVIEKNSSYLPLYRKFQLRMESIDIKLD